MILSFNKIVVFKPKSLIRVVYSMTKTTNFTYYYQSTNYQFYKSMWINKLLCGQDKTTIYTSGNYFLVLYIPLKYFTTFCKTTIIFLWNYYLGNRKVLFDDIQTKKYFGVVTACVFPQRFYSLMKPFFLKSLEQRNTDSLFTTIPLCYSLFGVGCTSGMFVYTICEM